MRRVFIVRRRVLLRVSSSFSQQTSFTRSRRPLEAIKSLSPGNSSVDTAADIVGGVVVGPRCCRARPPRTKRPASKRPPSPRPSSSRKSQRCNYVRAYIVYTADLYTLIHTYMYRMGIVSSRRIIYPLSIP